MKREDWTVTEASARPAGKPDECFYCNTPIGQQHAAGCGTRKRTVVITETIELVIDVPEDWDESMIEFSRNESSLCASNLFEELRELEKRTGSCLCRFHEAKFVREATAEDEEDQKLRVAELPG